MKKFFLLGFLGFWWLVFLPTTYIKAQHQYTVDIFGDSYYCTSSNQKVYTVNGLSNPTWYVYGGTIISYPASNQVLVSWTSLTGSVSVEEVYSFTVCEDICDEYNNCFPNCYTVTDTYSGNLHVNLLQPTIQSPVSTSSCIGTLINLTAYPSGAIYQWKKDGNSIAGANQQTYSVSASGLYTVQINVVGCSNETTPISLTVLQVPSTPSITAIASQSAPGSTQLQASNGNNYVWYKNNEKISNTNAPATLLATSAGTYKVENTNGVCASFSIPVEVFDSSPYPSVVTNKIKQGNIHDENQVNTLAQQPSVIQQEINYLSRQGQPLQNVLRAGSPTGKDVVSVYEYDPLGKESKSYLPIVVNQNTGLYVPNVINSNYFASLHYQFYNTNENDPSDLIPNDPKPFKVSIYENSPLGRVIEQGEIGEGYQPLTNGTNTPTIKFSYGTNAVNEVLQFSVNEYGTDFFTIEKGFYQSNTLNKQVTKTPKQNVIVSFTNKEGNIVFRKTQLDATSWAETYYVYDSRDNLRFILTPELVKYIQDNNLNSIGSEQPTNLVTSNTNLSTSNNASVYPYQNGSSIILSPGFTSANGFLAKPLVNTTYTISRYAYQFTYDHRNRKIAEKLPGADWTYFIYDNQDRLILAQPPNLRATNQWEFTKYDRFQRVILTGLVVLNQTISELRSLVKNHTILFEEPNSNGVHGYTNFAFPYQPNENLYQSVTYYDNYHFLSSFPTTVNWTYQPTLFANLPFQSNNRLRGAVTGTKIKIVNSPDWLHSTLYYDDWGQVIQSIKTNHIGGSIINSTNYDFTGKVLATRLQHNNGQQQYTITEEFEYDAAGRTLRHYHQIGNNIADRVLLEEFAYNELGERVTHKLHQKADNSFLQTVELRSNIRGQLLSQVSEDYQQTLGYDNTQGLPSAMPSYAGEITSIATTHNIKTTDKQYGWTFNYDKQSQLTASEQWERNVGTTTWLQPVNPIKESNFTYDLNGNIQTLTRSNAAGTIDNLQYNYGTGNNKSNQLLSISDATQHNDGFKDANTTGNDYTYDVAGNLVQDLNKNISSITYNELNLTQQITVTGVGYLTYLYTADGTKLADMLFSHTNQLLKRTDYASPFVYEQDFTQGNQRKLHSIQTAAGRVLPIPTGGFEYQYVLTDHLGSARMILSANPRTYTYKATMETANAVAEEMLFTNVAETRADAIPSSINQTPGGSKVAALNVVKPIGPALSLQVFPGDIINANVYVNHAGSGYGNTRITMSNLVSALVAAFGGGALTPSEAASLSNSFETNFNAEGLLAAPSENLPAAYLNFIVFDLEMNPIDMGYARAGSSSGVISRNNITITEPGYIYLYVSNEGSTSTNVYFDDLTVTLNESKLCGTYHNYPFGASIAELEIERWRMPSNQYRYQGKQYEDALGINLHDFHARLYGAYEARWFAIDPAGQFASPYNAMGNSPIIGIDPDGKFLVIPMIIGGVLGGYSGFKIGQSKNVKGWDMFQYVFSGAVIGSITSVVGASVTTGLGTGIGLGSQFGGLMGITLGGSIAGGISGFYMSGLAGKDPIDGAWKGAVSGLAGGFTGGYGASWKGAFIGGFVSGGVGASLNGAPMDEILKSAFNGGSISFLSYWASMKIEFERSDKFYNWKQFWKSSSVVQKSFGRGREHGGWFTENDFIENPKMGNRNQIKGERWADMPENAVTRLHTHPNKGKNWVENFSAFYDQDGNLFRGDLFGVKAMGIISNVTGNKTMANLNHLVIGRENSYSISTWAYMKGISPVTSSINYYYRYPYFLYFR